MSASAAPLQRLLFPLATRFVAGDSIPDALRAIERLGDAGLATTVAALGEDVATAAQADRTRDEYRRLIEGVAGRSLSANLSLKLSALGTKLGEDGYAQRCAEIVAYAGLTMRDPFVRVDMEGSSTVDLTLDTTVARAGGVWGPHLRAVWYALGPILSAPRDGAAGESRLRVTLRRRARALIARFLRTVGRA